MYKLEDLIIFLATLGVVGTSAKAVSSDLLNGYPGEPQTYQSAGQFRATASKELWERLRKTYPGVVKDSTYKQEQDIDFGIRGAVQSTEVDIDIDDVVRVLMAWEEVPPDFIKYKFLNEKQDTVYKVCWRVFGPRSAIDYAESVYGNQSSPGKQIGWEVEENKYNFLIALRNFFVEKNISIEEFNKLTLDKKKRFLSDLYLSAPVRGSCDCKYIQDVIEEMDKLRKENEKGK